MRCECLNCDTERSHTPNQCRRKARWFLEYHAVDLCVDNEPLRSSMCAPCFDAHVALANRTIQWGFEGYRSLFCQGCTRPLVRLSAIIRDVGRAA